MNSPAELPVILKNWWVPHQAPLPSGDLKFILYWKSLLSGVCVALLMVNWTRCAAISLQQFAKIMSIAKYLRVAS